MRALGIVQEDLRLKTQQDMLGLFNLNEPREVEALELCVKKHLKTHNHLKAKISRKRKEIIREDDEAEKKRKEQEAFRLKQLQKLEEEKQIIMKQLEEEQKKKDEHDRRRKVTSRYEDRGKEETQSRKSLSKIYSFIEKEHEEDKHSSQDANKPEELRESKLSEKEKKLNLDEELEKSNIYVFLDKSTQNKELLDLNMMERTKKQLENDKQKIKDLMNHQKKQLLEMSQKRNTSAYKSQEGLGNAKTRKIEYLYDLSKNPVDMMKSRQQKEMEKMMNYEISLQVDWNWPKAIKKQREDFLKNKHNFMKGEQQYKDVIFEYNRKILERERELKNMQKKIDQEIKLYHVERTRKANDFERQKMINKLMDIDNRANMMKSDRTDYLLSRKVMVQKLKKDLEEMKAGVIDIDQIEKKYHFLHDDKEFQRTMMEVKKDMKRREPMVSGKSFKKTRFQNSSARMRNNSMENSGRGYQSSLSPEKRPGSGRNSSAHKSYGSRSPDRAGSAYKRDELLRKQMIADLEKRQNREVLDLLSEEQKREKERTRELNKLSDPVKRERLEIKYDAERLKIKNKMKAIVKRHAEEIARLKN